LTNKKLGTVARTYHLSYLGSINRRVMILAGLDIKVSPYSKKSIKQDRLGVGLKWQSTCLASAKLLVQTQYHRKKLIKKLKNEINKETNKRYFVEGFSKHLEFI
jgi:hypothetical protein